MSWEERQAVIQMAVEETKGKVLAFPGCGAAGTLEAIKLCQYAESIGADGAMIVAPFYHIPEEEGMYRHFEQIAEGVGPDFGILVYNNPIVTGSWIAPHLMKRISEIPNIIAIKENTSDLFKYHAMRSEIDPEDAVVVTGMGEIMATHLAVFDCPGFISISANFAPGISCSVYEALTQEDYKKATQICNTLVDPFDVFIGNLQSKYGPHTATLRSWGGDQGYMYIGAIKAAMDIVGLHGGEVRAPLLGLDEEDKAELKRILQIIKVI
jgi:4-hydroxy-tetrahydrodipicolinate synthase